MGTVIRWKGFLETDFIRRVKMKVRPYLKDFELEVV